MSQENVPESVALAGQLDESPAIVATHFDWSDQIYWLNDLTWTDDQVKT